MLEKLGLSFTAIFNSARTTVDGGWRITFDLSNTDSDKISEIAALQHQLLQIAIIPIGDSE